MKKVIPVERTGFATRCVHAGVYKDSEYNSVVTPLYPSSTFYFERPRETSGYDYSRTANPTRRALEENLASLEEGAGATAVTTGMAAVTVALHLLDEGAHVVTSPEIYGGTYRLFADYLPKRNFRFSFVDMTDLDATRAAVAAGCDMVWIETPSNPLLHIVDIAGVCEVAREVGALSVVDNTFMTPYLQKPLKLGADISLHSATKYLNGHSDVVSGALIAGSAELAERIAATANALGVTSSPWDAWLVLRGVKTLPLRMEAHQRNAAALVEFLRVRSEVEKVYYPGLPDHPGHELAARQQTGFGGIVSFDIRGGEDAAFALIQGVSLYNFAESLGGVESLIEHPASMSHGAMSESALKEAGIGAGTIRVSVGIEAADDLLTDLQRGFEIAFG